MALLNIIGFLYLIELGKEFRGGAQHKEFQVFSISNSFLRNQAFTIRESSHYLVTVTR